METDLRYYACLFAFILKLDAVKGEKLICSGTSDLIIIFESRNDSVHVVLKKSVRNSIIY